ncbi:MAG: YsnF/AvaK domain-containing protein [Planctomycetaceae bacterium]|nr:YsnF/AvaK domain-containing protein [Planctomycetaceae bacterium]
MAETREQRSIVVGAFEDRHQADTAISDLRQAGFREDQIVVEEEARSGGGSESHRTTVTITAEGRYDEATAILRRHGAYDLQLTAHASRTAEGARIAVREEELQAHKQSVETGEVRVRKEVVTEHRSLEVPVQREEVVIERHAPTGEPGASDIRPGEELRIPVRKEQVTVEKRPVVKEEVTVGKRVVQGTEQVGGEVHREEVRVEREGDVDIREGEPDQK